VKLAAAILIDGVIDASWLFIVVVGLTLVFGVLNVLNFAYGSLFAVGRLCGGVSADVLGPIPGSLVAFIGAGDAVGKSRGTSSSIAFIILGRLSVIRPSRK
jgi:branched-subunit amino acid ABC-type transport system permease component